MKRELLAASTRAMHSRIELKRREVERFLAAERAVARFGGPDQQDAGE
jgi:hypothetical protein